MDIIGQSGVIIRQAAFVQVASAQLRNTSPGPFTISLASTPVPGNKLILGVALRDSFPGTPSATGFTGVVGQNLAHPQSSDLYYHDVAGGDGKDWIVNCNDHDAFGVILEVSGLAAGTAGDTKVGSGSSSSYSTAALTAAAKGIVVAMFSIDTTAGSISPGSGYTQAASGIAYQNVQPTGSLLYQIVSTPGSFTPNGTGPGTGWGAVSAFFSV